MIRLASGRHEELPCVWVLAGVLNHRPCHRRYECEGCDLYQALEGRHGEEKPRGLAHSTAERPSIPAMRIWPDPAEAVVSAYLAELTRGCALHLDRPYTTGHIWIQESSGDEILLGIDCQAIRVLHPLDDIHLPRPGTWLKRGEAMGWMLRGHLALPLRAPISGEVLEANETLREEMKDGRIVPDLNPWMIWLRPHERLDGLPDLLRGEEMLGWYQGKLALIRKHLTTSIHAAEGDTGPTLSDGGEPNRNLEEVLGSEAFQALVDGMFRAAG